MNRFFLPAEYPVGGQIFFPPEVAHQIARVLRLKPGEKVLVIDPHGLESLVNLETVQPHQVSGVIESQTANMAEAPLDVYMYLCVSQREKFEWMLQKCTEVGAAAFVPLVTQRSLVQDGREVERKRDRWEAILREAAEQCGRGRIPSLRPAETWAAALRGIHAGHDPALVAWEGEHALRLRDAVRALKDQPVPRLAVLIGPEGGLSEEEIDAARAAGVQAVSLGARILRMETAAVVAAALALDELEEGE